MIYRVLFFGIYLFALSCNSPSAHKAIVTKTYPMMQNIKIHYGADSLQFGHLMLPDTVGTHPVLMIIHGGCWRSKYDYTLMDSMSVDFSNRGYATWNIEYRRTEDEGGGWPGTFTDVALALKELKTIAEDYPIDLDNIIIVGHSAGGHLALMLGAQSKMNSDNPMKVEGLPSIKGIISLAGITDLATYMSPTGCGNNVVNLIDDVEGRNGNRLKVGSPITYLPLGIPQVLITGDKDDTVPLDHIRPYIDRAVELDDPIRVIEVAGAGHFEVITPGSVAWSQIVAAIRDLN